MISASVRTFEPYEAYQTPKYPMRDRIMQLVFGKNYIPSAGNQQSMLDALNQRNREVDLTSLQANQFLKSPLVEKLNISGNPFKAVKDIHEGFNNTEAMHNFGRVGDLSIKEKNDTLDALRNNFYKKAVEKLKGGAGDNIPDSKFSRKELNKGVKHESEHTSNKRIAKEIAKDHLAERKDYYTALINAKL